MDPAAVPPEAVARIQRWLAEEGVDASYFAFVARHVDVEDSGWRWCCNSSCDPCVTKLARVVELARASGLAPKS